MRFVSLSCYLTVFKPKTLIYLYIYVYTLNLDRCDVEKLKLNFNERVQVTDRDFVSHTHTFWFGGILTSTSINMKNIILKIELLLTCFNTRLLSNCIIAPANSSIYGASGCLENVVQFLRDAMLLHSVQHIYSVSSSFSM